MAFPLIPLLLGAAAGASATYIAMNKSTREKINQSADQVVETVKSGIEATKAKLSNKNTPPATTENASEQSTPIVEEKS